MTTTFSVLTFLNHEDEERIWSELVRLIPDVRVIDGSRWPDETPPLAPGPSQCANMIVYLWSPSIIADLPSRKRGDAYDGPTAGYVVEWSRSIESDDELRSGRIAAGYAEADEAMADFSSTVRSIFLRMTFDNLQTLEGLPVEYRIGEKTLEALAGGIRLRDRSVPAYFRPVNSLFDSW